MHWEYIKSDREKFNSTGKFEDAWWMAKLSINTGNFIVKFILVKLKIRFPIWSWCVWSRLKRIWESLTRAKRWWVDDMGQRISAAAAFVVYSEWAGVSICHKWSKEGTVTIWLRGHGQTRHINACREWKLVRVVWSIRRATVAQIAELEILTEDLPG